MHSSLPALTLFLLAASGASAQDLVIPEVSYPSLPKTAATKEALVPPGWKLESEVSGDLDGDGVADIAVVLHNTDPKNVLSNKDGLGEPSLDTNPRLLVVAFARRGGGYELTENHTLIPRRVSATVDDPLDNGEIAIVRGTLRVSVSFFASAGAWETWRTTYTLRYRHGRFELIGFDKHEVVRNSGEVTDVSINYLTRMKTVGTGTIENDKTVEKRTRIPAKPLLTLDEIGDGLEFDPDAGKPQIQ